MSDQLSENNTYNVSKVLLVDDEPAICHNLRDYLEDWNYQVEIAYNGKEGLERFLDFAPDLVVLDLHMPIMSGHELLKALNKESPHTPKIVLSGVGVISEAMETIGEGGWDFISKPVNDFDILLHKIKQAEEKATLHLQNRLYRKHLEELVDKKTADIRDLNEQLIDTQKEIFAKLGDVIETRSQETGYHVRRVAYTSRLLALAYGLTPEDAEKLRMASPLHDVGKIGIPDAILNKNGKLTEEEFELIKTHTSIGYHLLKGSDQPIIEAGAIIAYQHHERWDGTGYPNGLKGEDIHIYGRITCLADVYDALRQKRHYKNSWSEAECLDYFKLNSGTFFDPTLVELFLANLAKVEEIIQKFQQPSTVI